MSNLTNSLEIKGLNIKNRLVLPPIATDTCVNGRPTEKTFENYCTYAAGGVGTVIVEHNYVDIRGKFSAGQMAIDSTEYQQERADLAKLIKEHKAATGIQISHAGSGTKTEVTGHDLMAPTAIKHPTSGQIPLEMSQAQIKETINNFVRAALLVKDAGFDFVEIHAAHGYLLNEFYSPLTNKREDQYGGNKEKRLRMLLEVTQEIRKAVGSDYPIFMRLGAVDMMDGGNTEEDAAFSAPRIAEAGVDVFDISGGMCGSRPQGMVQGHFVPAAVAVKNAVNIPVMVTGGITDPLYAISLLREGTVDLVGVARAFMRDKEWVNQALAKVYF